MLMLPVQALPRSNSGKHPITETMKLAMGESSPVNNPVLFQKSTPAPLRVGPWTRARRLSSFRDMASVMRNGLKLGSLLPGGVVGSICPVKGGVDSAHFCQLYWVAEGLSVGDVYELFAGMFRLAFLGQHIDQRFTDNDVQELLDVPLSCLRYVVRLPGWALRQVMALGFRAAAPPRVAQNLPNESPMRYATAQCLRFGGISGIDHSNMTSWLCCYLGTS